MLRKSISNNLLKNVCQILCVGKLLKDLASEIICHLQQFANWTCQIIKNRPTTINYQLPSRRQIIPAATVAKVPCRGAVSCCRRAAAAVVRPDTSLSSTVSSTQQGLYDQPVINLIKSSLSSRPPRCSRYTSPSPPILIKLI